MVYGQTPTEEKHNWLTIIEKRRSYIIMKKIAYSLLVGATMLSSAYACMHQYQKPCGDFTCNGNESGNNCSGTPLSCVGHSTSGFWQVEGCDHGHDAMKMGSDFTCSYSCMATSGCSGAHIPLTGSYVHGQWVEDTASPTCSDSYKPKCPHP